MDNHTLIELDNGPLSHTLTFLNAKELSQSSASCQRFKTIAPVVWEELPTSTTTSRSWSSKQQAQRFYKAQQYAHRMEHICEHHFDYNNPDRTRLQHCRSCPHLPSLNTRCFRKLDDYEYFVRISYRKAKQPLIWEGFVPSVTKSNYNTITLDLQHIYPHMQWDSMRNYLAKFKGSLSTDEPDILALLYEAMDNLKITVIAMELTYPWNTHLIVGTGGFHDSFVNISDNELSYSINPRMVQSHAFHNDQDWISVEVQTSERGSQLLGISLRHEW